MPISACNASVLSLSRMADSWGSLTSITIFVRTIAYGHVIFAKTENNSLPELVKRLSHFFGADWALLIFIDNGLIETEVALKLTIRKRHVDAPHDKHLSAQIISSQGIYYDDTLAVINCCEESDCYQFQTSWYEAHVLCFLEVPIVGLPAGDWTVEQSELLDSSYDLVT